MIVNAKAKSNELSKSDGIHNCTRGIHKRVGTKRANKVIEVARNIFKRLKENAGIIIAFAPIAFFIIVTILILSGILKVHIEF